MDPAKPPLPIPWNFPFQPALGIHTSNSMSESSDGLMTPDTRQKAGRSGIAGPCGGLKDPAGTDSAVLIVVVGRASLASASQLVGAADRAPPAKIVSKVTVATLRAMVDILPIMLVFLAE